MAACSTDAESAGTFDRVIDAHLRALSSHHGFDPSYGRRLPADLESAGVALVGCEGRVSIWRGGGRGMRVWQITFAQLHDEMLALGADASQIDRAIALCDDPELGYLSPLVMAAWGRTRVATG